MRRERHKGIDEWGKAVNERERTVKEKRELTRQPWKEKRQIMKRSIV
jgi:hypothetical protein